jgi:hypothetical protein
VRAWLDDVSGLVKELADVTDALVDRLGPDAEQGGDGDLGQGEPLVEDGGQGPVGQGEEGAAAGAGGGQSRAVTAALVQAGLPLLVVQRHQRGDQGVPLVVRQAGQRRVAEPFQVGAGLVEPVGDAGGLVVCLGAPGVVPVAVPVVAGQRQGGHLPVADLDAGGIGAGVQLRADPQPGAGGGGCDGLHDDLMAGQRPAAPVHRDVGEQPVLDLVPLRRPWREVVDTDLQPGLHGQLSLPRAGAVAVGTARVRRDQQAPGCGVVAAPGRPPPAADRFDGEGRGVMVGADADPVGVAGDVVDPVGHRLGRAVPGKSWVRVAAGSPRGRHSRPPFLNSPTSAG